MSNTTNYGNSNGLDGAADDDDDEVGDAFEGEYQSWLAF